MTRWTEDPALDAPDGHLWLTAEPDSCPACDCCTKRLCERAAAATGFRPDGPNADKRGVPCEYVCQAGDRGTVAGCPCTAHLPA